MYIKVLVELSSFNIDKTFTYKVPEEFIDKIQVGIRVIVPFANQKLEGFILEILDENNNEDYEIKEIYDVVDDEVILNDELLELGKFVSKTTLSTLISAYQVMLPKALKAQARTKLNIQYDTYLSLGRTVDESTLTPKQKEIIDLIKEKKVVLLKDAKKVNSSVDTLIKKEIIKKVFKEKYRLIDDEDTSYEKKILTGDQQKVCDEILEGLHKNDTYLLYGVTGSGKTEVYMEVMEHVIKDGKQALLLVPEITLTSQILKRFRKRFKNIAVLHSALSDGERYDEYRRIKKGEVDIVIGTRSAVFAPLTKIGIIIIDECHTDSYKQDNMPRYDSIKVALERAKNHSCPVVLGSATPTLEMFARAQKGLYKLLVLDKRVGKAILPKITMCDMTHEQRVQNTSFSKTLYENILETITKGEQVILLMNRRGYSSSVMCKNCGYTIKCPHCDISLTYHKNKDLLRCHYCGYAINKSDTCPSCHEKEIRELGSGTEKVEEELNLLFPEAKIVRMDLDTTSRKGSHEKIINDFAEGRYNILLGTQMIAKGLDFPNVTLVGVINADTSLFIPSYKSSENTFQLLNQVAGRAGRSEKLGKVVIQTFNKDHYAITHAASSNYLSFYQEEMKIRLESQYPPYYYLVSVIVKAKEYDLVSKESNKISSILKNHLTNSIVLGPTVCVPFKVNNICRFGIIIKYKKEEKLYSVLENLIEHYKANNKITIDIDFNPHNI